MIKKYKRYKMYFKLWQKVKRIVMDEVLKSKYNDDYYLELLKTMLEIEEQIEKEL